jgi:hypothetical protein
LKDITGVGSDHLADAISVLLTPHQGLQNQQIERAL